ncbi:MAG: TonB-dependent receptor, partial [Gemmatimonadetes bacterium]|nr:TonB-dependent receptor [Gemmatimonadota bacterium]
MTAGRIAAALLLWVGTAQAQTVTVTDASTGAPVPGAFVEWENGGSSVGGFAVTDGEGVFESLGDEAPGTVYRVRALGYREISVAWSHIAESGNRIVLQPTAIQVDELVVTATGRPVRRSEVAVPIETMGEVELRAGSAPGVDRLLSSLPSIQQTGQAPTGTNLMIRGIGGSRVLVLLDGQPAGGALLENRDVSRMSLAGVAQVEVVKGPLSSLYGSDALGGVINLVTRRPRDGFQADASVLAGGGGRTEAHATAEGGGEAFRYRVTGSWRQEDRVPGLVGGSDAFARVWDLRATGRGERAGWSYRSDASFVRERQRWPVGGGFSGFNDNTGLSGWSQVERSAGSGRFGLRIFGQSYDHLYRSARGDLPFESEGDETQTERLVRASASYGVALGSHALDLGAEASARRIRSPDKILSDEASDNQLAVYAQDAWRVGESTTVTGGTRGTFNDRWGSTASPTLGISHALGTSFRIRGSLSRGFRAPSFKELTWNFANLGAGYTVLG